MNAEEQGSQRPTGTSRTFAAFALFAAPPLAWSILDLYAVAALDQLDSRVAIVVEVVALVLGLAIMWVCRTGSAHWFNMAFAGQAGLLSRRALQEYLLYVSLCFGFALLWLGLRLVPYRGLVRQVK